MKVEDYYKHKFNDKIKKKYMAKVHSLCYVFSQLFPSIEMDVLVVLLSRCSHFHAKERKDLDTDAMIVYEQLKRMKLHPCTVYKWFLAYRAPDPLLNRLNDKQLTQKQVLHLATYQRRYREMEKGQDIMKHLRSLVRLW